VSQADRFFAVFAGSRHRDGVARPRASLASRSMEAAHAAAVELDEESFRKIESTMLYLEEARARAERAAKEMQAIGAETHLIAATEGLRDDLGDLARRYRHRTYFAAPQAQTSF
jgi:hypothetical protein